MGGVSRFLLLLLCAIPLVAGAPEAVKAYRRGLKAERAGDYAAAREAYTEAAREEPTNVVYITRREMARQREAFGLVSEAIRLMDGGRYAEAAGKFAAATGLDPSNDFARQQQEAAEAKAKPAPPPEPADWRLEARNSPPLALEPRPVRRSWDLRGDPHALYLALGAGYGIQFVFDEEVGSHAARLVLEDADFRQALRVAGAITNTFAAPLDAHKAIVAPENSVKRNQYERQTLKNLDASQLGSPEAVNEVANLLRVLLEMRQVSVNLPNKLITVRDSTVKVLAAEQLVLSLAQAKPQVMIEIQSVEVNSGRARQLGLLPALQYQVSRLSSLAKPGAGPDILTPCGAGGESSSVGPEGPVRICGGSTSPQPAVNLPDSLAALGKGKTFLSLTPPQANFVASLSRSLTRSLTTIHLRAGDGQPAIFLFGARYPIVVATFSAIFLTGPALQQQQSGALLNPFPAFTFEDLGVKVKATPRVHAEGEVTLALEVQTRSLSGTSFNGVPGISNREFQGQVRLADGQTVILTGILNREESRSLQGLPGLADLTGIGLLFGQQSRPSTDTEVLLLITPHVLRLGPAQTMLSETIPVPTDYVPILGVRP